MTQNIFQIASWLNIPQDSDFPLYNIPFGMAVIKGNKTRAVTRIGNYIINLNSLNQAGFLKNTAVDKKDLFKHENLNSFISLGRKKTGEVRTRIAELFSEGNTELKSQTHILEEIIYQLNDVKMIMPVKVGDYTDFYSSMEHATNVGKMFRDPENALLPNWKHLPVGYHGRASSIVISGTPLHRPKGQLKYNDSPNPVFGPTKEMDFELEIAFITCNNTKLGESISVNKAEEAIIGMLLFNDMSARDIQRWEYVPLGPFLSKSFGSVVSPWIVTLDALEPFRTTGPVQDTEVLPYLKSEGNKNFDISLEAIIKPVNSDENVVCRTNFKYMYWNIAQQLAHQTINGCNINSCDMYASGTISGHDAGSYGSMLELAWKGQNPIQMNNGETRTFLHDNDTIIIRGHATKDNLRIGFGEVSTKVLPSLHE